MAYEDGLAVATARERNADLIVTGSHGRTGLERILLGSTTERVLNDTVWSRRERR